MASQLAPSIDDALELDGDSHYYCRAEDELDHEPRPRHPDPVNAPYALAGFYIDCFYGGPERRAERPELVEDDYLPGDGDRPSRFPGERR